MLRNRLLVALWGGLLAAAPGGCGRTQPVSVVVTLDGKPVEGATVTLNSVDGAGRLPASGVTAADGTVALTCPGEKGVPPGTYKAVVSKRPPTPGGGEAPDNPQEAMKKMGKAMMAKGRMLPAKSPSALPEVYEDQNKTPLPAVKVPPDSSPVALELKSRP